jgi:uncharacterized protein (DUF433 family)
MAAICSSSFAASPSPKPPFDYNDDIGDNVMTAPLSLRLPARTAAKVHQLSAIERRTYADMVRVLVEEAIRMREFPGVYFVDGPTGRRARIAGGPDVWEILQPYLVAGKSWDALRESFPHLPERVLRDALAYYDAYPEEIEARVATSRAA